MNQQIIIFFIVVFVITGLFIIFSRSEKSTNSTESVKKLLKVSEDEFNELYTATRGYSKLNFVQSDTGTLNKPVLISDIAGDFIYTGRKELQKYQDDSLTNFKNTRDSISRPNGILKNEHNLAAALNAADQEVSALPTGPLPFTNSYTAAHYGSASRKTRALPKPRQNLKGMMKKSDVSDIRNSYVMTSNDTSNQDGNGQDGYLLRDGWAYANRGEYNRGHVAEWRFVNMFRPDSLAVYCTGIQDIVAQSRTLGDGSKVITSSTQVANSVKPTSGEATFNPATAQRKWCQPALIEDGEYVRALGQLRVKFHSQN